MPYCREPLGGTTSGAEKLISEPEGKNALEEAPNWFGKGLCIGFWSIPYKVLKKSRH